ncbi:MAG: NAD(P)/FAD-dependent oxidoreductase [Thermomicrobiales bacterium]|nr:NAD(P)/FAD-dependent oxidoreductase [Thermomicrobiales bacterium]
MDDVEVIVVGGGPGGSTVAAELASVGRRVLLLDRARFPRHKACSEYVNPGGVAILRRLGVLDEVLAAGAHRMEAMLVHAPGGDRFLANFAGLGTGHAAVGLSRHRLDALLLERARAAGVDVREGAWVRSVVRDGGRVVGVEAAVDGARAVIRAPLVIGADGHSSVVARDLGLTVRSPWLDKTGLVAHYRGVTGLDRWGEMHIGDGFYVGLAPLEEGLTNVAVVAGAKSIAARDCTVEQFFVERLGRLPEVAGKLAGAQRAGGIRGVGSMAHRARRVAGDGYLLVGDAASFLDPFTGEGIYEAMRAALLAAPVADAALAAGDASAAALAPYRLARRRVFTAKRQVCWIVQGFINAPPLMNYVTPRLAERVELGSTLAGVLGNIAPAGRALSPRFLARLLRP